MKHSEDLLDKLQQVIDDLILNAEKLKELSLQVVAGKEISLLQSKQEALVKQLGELDHQIKNQKIEIPAEFTKKMENKIKKFQELNASYIQNLTTTHEVIRFDKPKHNK
jgi:hypothetical protein